jgi:integrase
MADPQGFERMPRTINKLSDTAVKAKNDPGRYADGGGLYLQVSSYGTKAWVFRYMLNGKARHMGLGAYPTFKLAEARERARKARQQLTDGIDPLATKDEQKAVAKVVEAKRVTFKDAAERYIKAKGDEWKNAVHRSQWENTLKTYAEPIIGSLDVGSIETAHILNVLEPIWRTKTETASRVRGRIESVLDWATFHKFRSGENPARWRGHLDQVLPARSKVAKPKSHPAMPYAAISGFMGKLRDLDGVSARALEFTILTAARTGETIGARRDEIDMDGKVWTVPADRMKAGKEHRVPLSDRAIAILKALPSEGDYVFPGAKKDKPLSNMAMLELLRQHGPDGLTVHGFRSTFRDWAGETTAHPREVIEHALAHQLADKAEAAYQRGDLLAKRARLMADWARYCAKLPTVGNVVDIEQARA